MYLSRFDSSSTWGLYWGRDDLQGTRRLRYDTVQEHFRLEKEPKISENAHPTARATDS